MRLTRHVGIRLLFPLFLLIAVLPISALLAGHILHDQEAALGKLYREAEQVGNLTANRLSGTINSTRQFLTVLVHSEEINSLDGKSANAFLSDLAPHYGEYANIGLALPNGINIASVIPLGIGNDSSSQPWYRRLQKDRDFTVGDFQIGKLTKKPGINFALPLSGRQDSGLQGSGPVASVYVALNLKIIDAITTEANLPPDAAILVIDANQKILSRYPNADLWRGQTQPEITGKTRDQETRFIEGVGIDGKTRLYFRMEVPGSNGQLSVMIGLSKDGILKETNREILAGFLSLLTIALLSLGLAGWIGRTTLIRPLLDLGRAARRIGAGEFSARVETRNGIQEIAQLTASFNLMASSLEHNLELTQVWIDTMPSLVYQKNRDGAYLACNKAFAGFWGKPKSDIIGKTTADLIGTEEAAFHAQKDAELYAKGGALSYEAELETADHTFIYALFNKAAYVNEKGEVDGIVGTIVDISERKKTENRILNENRDLEKTVSERTENLELANRELKEARMMLQSVLDTIPSRVFWKDTASRYLGCNLAFARDAGLENAESIIGLSDDDLPWKNDAEKYREDDRTVLQSGRSRLAFEEKVQVAGQNAKTVMTSKIPLTDLEGRPVGILCVYEDISEQKRLMRDRDAFFDVAIDMVAIASLDGYFTQVSPSWSETLGWSAEELTGRPYMDFVHPDDIAGTIAAASQLSDGVNIMSFDNRYRCKDGSYRWLSWRTSVSMEQKLAFAIARDITDIKATQIQLEKLNAELIKAKEEAETADRAKSAFLANMSHEIRTPMNAILGFSEILANLVAVPKQKEYLEAIRSSGKTLLTLINDILDLSKIEAGKMEIRKTPVDIAGLIREIGMIFREKCREKNLFLNLDIPSDIPGAILIDGIRLRQILFNLVGNAVKFTENGGITLSLKCGQNKDTMDKYRMDLDIGITDTGIGIPESQQEIIFQPFRQQDGQIQAAYGGTGLGLTISRRLAAIMDGSISLRSEPGSGSAFTVRFNDVEQALTLESDSPDTLIQSSFVFRDCKVLIADDMTLNRELLVAMLEIPGISVRAVQNGAEAIEAAGQEKPDIILMDIRMPVMDGFAAVGHFKSDPVLRSIPVIAITASVMGNAEQDASEAGFDGYLRKPIKRLELLRLITALLAGKAEETAPEADAPDGAQDRPELCCGDSRELRALLTDVIIPRCERLQSRIFIDEIRDLAREVDVIARDYSDEALRAWVLGLRERIGEYDTKGISGALAGLKNLLGGQTAEKGEPR